MPQVRAKIRKNATGECRWYIDSWHQDGAPLTAEDKDTIAFLWGDGNFACDCNRRDLFARAGNEPDPPDDEGCSSEKYSVLVVETLDGEVIYDGDADAPAAYYLENPAGH